MPRHCFAGGARSAGEGKSKCRVPREDLAWQTLRKIQPERDKTMKYVVSDDLKPYGSQKVCRHHNMKSYRFLMISEK